MSAYLLDTNVFIQAKNLHYGFDFCPAFWDWLVEQNSAERVVSIEQVADELYAKEDELTDWAKKRGGTFFLVPDNAVNTAMSDVSDWANSGNYKPAAVHNFLQAADCWVVAHALAHGYTIVTHENRAKSIWKIKIPDACDAHKLRCMTPYEMLRRENVRFVLGRNQTVD